MKADADLRVKMCLRWLLSVFGETGDVEAYCEKQAGANRALTAGAGLGGHRVLVTGLPSREYFSIAVCPSDKSVVRCGALGDGAAGVSIFLEGSRPTQCWVDNRGGTGRHFSSNL